MPLVDVLLLAMPAMLVLVVRLAWGCVLTRLEREE